MLNALTMHHPVPSGNVYVTLLSKPLKGLVSMLNCR